MSMEISSNYKDYKNEYLDRENRSGVCIRTRQNIIGRAD